MMVSYLRRGFKMMLDIAHIIWAISYVKEHQTEIQASFWSRYKDITRSNKQDKDRDDDEMVTEDFETEEITIAETNAWFQLQKYKPRCDDYYLNENQNDTADENTTLSAPLLERSIQ